VLIIFLASVGVIGGTNLMIGELSPVHWHDLSRGQAIPGNKSKIEEGKQML